MNRTLMEKEMNMLSDVAMKQEFWLDVVDMMCYIVNRSSSTTLVEKTPYESWVGKNNSLAHIKVF